MEAVLPIMSQFPEIETCVEVSRRAWQGWAGGTSVEKRRGSARLPSGHSVPVAWDIGTDKLSF